MKSYREFIQNINESALEDTLRMSLMDVEGVEKIKNIKTESDGMVVSYVCYGKNHTMKGINYNKQKDIFTYKSLNGGSEVTKKMGEYNFVKI